ncbi:hypothetical protein D6779_00895 [Candidatus Parcubacteria bacterium]|nr:MAG: hypothetical protein D6779_00895 [Candidatus Parcubacteria bacterium]
MTRDIHIKKKRYNHREWILIVAAFLLAAVFLVGTYVWGIQFMLRIFLSVFHTPSPPAKENVFQFERAEKLRMFTTELPVEQAIPQQPGKNSRGKGYQ